MIVLVLLVVVVLGGIYGGIFTPTEAAVVGCVYALFVGKFIYRELDFVTTRAAFVDTLIINGGTSFILGLSISFANSSWDCISSATVCRAIPTLITSASVGLSRNAAISRTLPAFSASSSPLARAN